jgi:hypothetical protein
MMLDVRGLRVLMEVARRGSLSAAAEALSSTASAVSRQIAALEILRVQRPLSQARSPSSIACPSRSWAAFVATSPWTGKP